MEQPVNLERTVTRTLSDHAINTDQSEEAYIMNRWPWIIAFKYLMNRVGLPTFLVMFGLGVWTGHIPSPFMDIAASLNAHVHQTDKLLALLIAQGAIKDAVREKLERP